MLRARRAPRGRPVIVFYKAVMGMGQMYCECPSAHIKKRPQRDELNLCPAGLRFSSAFAGNGTLTREDQLVDVRGNGTDDLHRITSSLFLLVIIARDTENVQYYFVKNL